MRIGQWITLSRKVRVHVHQARHHRLIAKIHDRRSGYSGIFRRDESVQNGCDTAVFYDNGLITKVRFTGYSQ